MATLRIKRRHAFPIDEARVRLEDLVEAFSSRFPATRRWEGDTLYVTGSGFEGRVVVTADTLAIDVTLGFGASLFKSRIESRLNEELGKRFGAV